MSCSLYSCCMMFGIVTALRYGIELKWSAAFALAGATAAINAAARSARRTDLPSFVQPWTSQAERLCPVTDPGDDTRTRPALRRYVVVRHPALTALRARTARLGRPAGGLVVGRVMDAGDGVPRYVRGQGVSFFAPGKRQRSLRAGDLPLRITIVVT